MHRRSFWRHVFRQSIALYQKHRHIITHASEAQKLATAKTGQNCKTLVAFFDIQPGNLAGLEPGTGRPEVWAVLGDVSICCQDESLAICVTDVSVLCIVRPHIVHSALAVQGPCFSVSVCKNLNVKYCGMNVYHCCVVC